MRPLSVAAGGQSNSMTAAPFIENEGAFSALHALMAVCRRIWPDKTAANIAARTGVSERCAAFWLAGKYQMPLAAAHRLIRSEHGFLFLEALMAGSKQTWWRATVVAHRAGAVRRTVKRARNELSDLHQEQEALDL